MNQSSDQQPSATYFLGLDGLRGLAILMVMLSHFVVIGGYLQKETPLNRLLQSGHLGVDLFFALSGFLITGILIDSKGRKNFFKGFYWRRSLRIFPLYYLVLALAALSVVVLSPWDRSRLTGVDSPAWFWLYASNLGMIFKGTWLNSPQWISLGHFWSLAVEEQFYCVWPLVVYLTPVRRLFRLCLILIVLSLIAILVQALTIGSMLAYVSTISRISELAAGAAMALLWRSPSEWCIVRRWLKPTLIVSAGMMLLVRLFKPLECLEPVLALLIGAGLVAVAASRESCLVSRMLESGVLRWLGKYSYGIYVYHHALSPVWYHFLWNRWIVPHVSSPFWSVIVYIISAGLISLLLAWISWRCFEQPILSLKNRYFRH